MEDQALEPRVERGCCGKRQEVAQKKNGKAQAQEEAKAPAVAAPQEAIRSHNRGTKARCRSWMAAMWKA
jgi:hypothetical protein